MSDEYVYSDAPYRKRAEAYPDEVKGNPRALSMAKMKKICNLIRCGNYVKTSVTACDVNYNTYLSCMRKGKQGISPYDEYYAMQEEAKAQFESGAVSKIAESGEQGNIGAYMWMLPRMYPNRWGKVNRQEVKVDNKQEIQIVKFSDKNKEDKGEE